MSEEHPSIESATFKEGDTHDVKMARTQQAGVPRCWKCDYGTTYPKHHSEGCPNIDLPSALHTLRQVRAGETWARKRAAYWLDQVRQMYSAHARMKHEIKILRERCKQLEKKLKDA